MRDKKLPYIWSITDDININIKKSAKDIENFSQNLYVECAEKAIDVRNFNRCICIFQLEN